MINQAATDPDVLAKVLRRFGCSTATEGHRLGRALLNQGVVDTEAGHRVRLVAFGTAAIDPPGPYLTVLLSDVVAYIDRYLTANWELVRSAGSRDPIFGVMILLAKARGTQR